MTVYLARETALAAFRHLRTVNISYPPELRLSRRRTLRNPVDTESGLRAMCPEAREFLNELPRPLHVLTNRPGAVRSGDELATHLCGNKVPEGSFVDLGNDVFATSPAFTFVQMGTTYSLGGLVMLGLEFCGNYSPIPLEEGFRDRMAYASDPERDGMAHLIPSQLRAADLARFVDRCDGRGGVRQARLAARWVLDNSNSLQESATYVLLSLPRLYGGYGLPKPIFNSCVRVTSANGWKSRFPDLYWRESSVDVEYQSDYAHTGSPERFYADSRRFVQLTAREVRVLPLTKRQLYSPELFDEFAHKVARLVGHKVRKAAPDWWIKRDLLRDAALFDKPLRK